jgi:type I restriction-modification system DNA methylase subunit
MLGVLVMDLETGPTDVLGSVYHELELHNKWAGQYFTPFTICEFMAKMTLADSGDLKEKIEARGFVRAAEPSCGSGAMMIALALGMKAEGINYQQDLHVTATDVDLKCVHMCFIQSSLLGIPAVIIHGNSLTLASLGRGASDLLLDERD